MLALDSKLGMASLLLRLGLCMVQVTSPNVVEIWEGLVRDVNSSNFAFGQHVAGM